MIKKIGLYAVAFLATSGLHAQENRSCYNLRASVSPLYWKAQEEGLDYMIKNSSGASIVNDGKVIRADFDWDWGFKVGLGYDIPCRCTDFDVTWTRFYSSGKDSVSATFPEALFPVWTDPTTNLSAEEEAQAKVSLHLNKIDLQISSVYSPHCFLSLKPRVGLSVALIDQKFSINANDGVSLGPTAVVLDDAISMKNDFWGIGPQIGMDTSWCLGRGFSFFGNIDFTILYGCFNLSQNETVLFTNGVPETTFLDVHDNSYYLSRPSVDLIIGFRWDTLCFCNDLSFEAGWEHLYFFGQNQLMRFVDDQNPGINIPIKGDLTIQGLTLRASLCF